MFLVQNINLKGYMRLSFINSYFDLKNSENSIIIGVSCETNVKFLLIIINFIALSDIFTNTSGYICRILFIRLVLMILIGF